MKRSYLNRAGDFDKNDCDRSKNYDLTKKDDEKDIPIAEAGNGMSFKKKMEWLKLLLR